MNSKRSAFQALHFKNYIYVAGGFDGGFSLDTVERYDLVAGKWEKFSRLQLERVCSSLVAIPCKFNYGADDFKGNEISPNNSNSDPPVKKQSSIHNSIRNIMNKLTLKKS